MAEAGKVAWCAQSCQQTVLRSAELRPVLEVAPVLLVRPVRDDAVVRDVPDAPVAGRAFDSLHSSVTIRYQQNSHIRNNTLKNKIEIYILKKKKVPKFKFFFAPGILVCKCAYQS